MSNSNPNGNLNQSQNVTSPKLNKSQDINFEEVNSLMKKKSPLKPENDISMTSDYSSANRMSRTPPNFYKN